MLIDVYPIDVNPIEVYPIEAYLIGKGVVEVSSWTKRKMFVVLLFLGRQHGYVYIS